MQHLIVRSLFPRLQIMSLLEQEFPDTFYMSGQQLRQSIDLRVGRHAPGNGR